ncbi:DNA repair exonuclease [Alkalibacterium olivapovliticus]|uniref:DNA repair exonuclease SbcCD nuclease subunit n=1 Tax=Alkalibacterium olivapovliticus TaxID=99907 RepID=A0A2T0W2Q3_9LACT|nr:DNA repair exonuclease [Alkalibacterium olivapovliticus]PRY79084.1 DNA repair exonuclease SbcCD nuclease subunit [Alkalibacterium olivapovliticus]
MIRFIHAADLHLDSPYIGLKELSVQIADQVKESTFQSLENIVEQAISHQVMFVLFSGDIYDLEDRSIKAQIRFRQQMERLRKHSISVYLIHGNHDFIASKSDHLSLPSNVKVFSPAVETEYIETDKGETIAVSGFSYDKRWIDKRMISEYPVRGKQVDYHIGMLHGYEEGQNSDHGRYAPFSLNELISKDYDYWALGHIHKRQMLSSEPPVYYSGNTQGRHKNEAGEKGCLLVELSQSGKQIQFISTAPVIWDRLTVDASMEGSLNSIYEHIKKEMASLPERNILLNLVVSVSPDLKNQILKKIKQAEFTEALHIYADSYFVHITSVKIKIKSSEGESVSLAELFPEEWDKSISHFLLSDPFYNETSELLSAHPFSKELKEPSERYRKEIVDSAVTLLKQDLGSIEGD